MTEILVVAGIALVVVAMNLWLTRQFEKAKMRAEAMVELDKALSDLKSLSLQLDAMAEKVKSERSI